MVQIERFLSQITCCPSLSDCNCIEAQQLSVNIELSLGDTSAVMVSGHQDDKLGKLYPLTLRGFVKNKMIFCQPSSKHKRINS